MLLGAHSHTICVFLVTATAIISATNLAPTRASEIKDKLIHMKEMKMLKRFAAAPVAYHGPRQTRPEVFLNFKNVSLCVPLKSGMTAMMTALCRRCDGCCPPGKHVMSAAPQAKQYRRVPGRRYARYAVIRNPVERFVSYFHHWIVAPEMKWHRAGLAPHEYELDCQTYNKLAERMFAVLERGDKPRHWAHNVPQTVFCDMHSPDVHLIDMVSDNFTQLLVDIQGRNSYTAHTYRLSESLHACKRDFLGMMDDHFDVLAPFLQADSARYLGFISNGR